MSSAPCNEWMWEGEVADHFSVECILSMNYATYKIFRDFVIMRTCNKSCKIYYLL